VGENFRVMGQRPAKPDSYFSHWADQAARQTMAAHPDAEIFVVAAGITPSGVVHIGNLREVITVDFLARALRDQGAKVRFIYSWDDFDVFRKVPKDMPEQEMLQANLRRSIADVPDPCGAHDSYASHQIDAFERSIEPLRIEPEFIRQSRRYRAGEYAQGIRRALEQRNRIREILDRHRNQLLGDDWLPLAGFCDDCGRDRLDFGWDGEWCVSYRCRGCGHEHQLDLREGGNVKLPWRIDWPMRWAHEGVSFEPGGKDHTSAGGSYDTAKEIVRDVYDARAPEYVAYDFVRIKGRGGKISSSAGDAVTVGDALEIYEPEMLRWLFASYRPNTEFQVSFDLDVIKLYEDYDRTCQTAHQADDGGRGDKKRQTARRTLQLASVDNHRIQPGDPLSFVPAFRPLSVILQIYDGDIERARAYYQAAGSIRSEGERHRFRERARRVWTWIDKYAPGAFRYRIRSEATVRELSDHQATALRQLVETLRREPDLDEDALVSHVKSLFEDTPLRPEALFPVIYDLLIGRPKGPKLTTLLATMGAERALPLLEPSLEARDS
jgi:lysyl-tRNA synthetase class 1